MWNGEPVAIIGANMGGMAAARALAGRVEAVVYDPGASLQWLPNIHELLSGLKRPQNLRLQRAPLVHRYGHQYQRHAVTGINWRRHILSLDDGSEQFFSRAIVAVGGVNNTFGVPGASEHAMPFKSVLQCRRIAVRLQETLGRGDALNVVLVGGGIEGVEALGEILRRYRHHAGLSLTVVDAASRLLPALPAGVDEHLRALCPSTVRFCFGEHVTRVSADSVSLGDTGTLPADLVIWTGGAGAHPLLADSGLADDTGFAPVRKTLQSIHNPNVFVVGDAVADVDGARISPQAYHAMDMGRLAARNVDALIRHRPLQAFRPAHKPQLITFGDLDTLLVTDDRVWASPALRSLKEAVYQLGMAQLDGRRPWRRGTALFRRALEGGIDEAIDLLRAPPALGRMAGMKQWRKDG
jgi:NADH dehydrogenase